ncbi:hypothetical protein PDESU_06139 [Pontiella desulfatans]|uniref:Uncharacterized protein n=1 Tax=Pontiella desulfatans TaxID=2750659 RepID=A0A6C2UBJ5_PONDE|nr:hypothetical protein [Pontiella desulfatans]VGO17542.1 hypothetical protein PDESU_06139 [Pontiella desulfatans]
MDIGKFKSSRGRLTLWVMIPPLLIVGVGLSTYALRLQSEWQLNRTQGLCEVLPKLMETQRQTLRVLEDFHSSKTKPISSEDELISFVQDAARKAEFTIDSLKVERRASAQNGNMPVLLASVNGNGAIDAIQRFLADVSVSQHLLSERSLQIAKQANGLDDQICKANITFELVLFKGFRSGAGGNE